jgi:hypothetical protein
MKATKMTVRYLLGGALPVSSSVLLAGTEPIRIYLTCKDSGERKVTNKVGGLTETVGGIGGHPIGERNRDVAHPAARSPQGCAASRPPDIGSIVPG